jgi:hypothetical protein
MKAFSKRLKGFEPSTFCMASSTYARPIWRTWLQKEGFAVILGPAGGSGGLHEVAGV